MMNAIGDFAWISQALNINRKDEPNYIIQLQKIYNYVRISSSIFQKRNQVSISR